MTARGALALATIDGARCLGRDDELGSLEPGKLADVALWRLDGLDHAGHRRPRRGARPRRAAPGRPAARRRPRRSSRAPSCARATSTRSRPTSRARAAAARPSGGGGVTIIPRDRRPASAARSSAPTRSASRPSRADGVPKVKGEFEYASDMRMEGMLYGATLRSPHPRADIWGIDIGRGAGHPRRPRRAHPRRRARAQDLRHGGPRPARARHRPRALPGRAGRDRRRRPPRDRPPRGRRDRRRLRACSSR